MNITRRIAFAGVAAWFSRGLTIVLGLVVMPVLFRHLPKEELGLWLLLGQGWASMGILDFGFGVTLTRRIALAKGKSGSDPNGVLTPDSQSEIADLVTSGALIYRLLAAGLFVVTMTLGLFYLRDLPLESTEYQKVWLAWTIVCLCQALTVWSTVWTCLLAGVGYVGWEALIASLVSALTLVSQILAVLMGGGIVALACVAAIGAILQRIVTRWLARRTRPELFSMRGEWNPSVMRGMPGLAVRAWLTVLGGVLVHNSDGFFIASTEGAAGLPAFRAAYLVVLNLHMMAGVFGSSSMVFISHLWQAGEVGEVQRIVKRNLRIGLSIVLAGSAGVLAAGDSLFNVWLGPANYAGWQIVALFALIFVLEQQTFLIATGCRATEDEAFAGWTMAGGALKLLLAYVLMRQFGLLGLPLATLGAQLLTSHWYTAYRGLARLQIPFQQYLATVVTPSIAVFVAAAATSFGAVYQTRSSPDWIILAAACASSGMTLAVALLIVGLDSRQRIAAVSRLGLHRWLPASGRRPH